MNTWIVDPSEEWLTENVAWMPVANVLFTLCPATLMGVKCILIEGHTCSHAIRTPREPVTVEDIWG